MPKAQEQLLSYLLQGYIPVRDFKAHSLFMHYALLYKLIEFTEDKRNVMIKKTFALRRSNGAMHSFKEGEKWTKEGLTSTLMTIFDLEYDTNYRGDMNTWNRI